MRKAAIHPSPALCVSAHTTVSHCVRMMRDRNLGSLLIMNPAKPDELQGIFTERDLLKWIDEIQHGGHWEKPVAHVMSKPVKTLPVERLDDAAEIMLSGGFRHLPVTQKAPGGKTSLLGILSMRDLLKLEFAEKKARKPTKPARIRNREVIFLGDGSPARKLQSEGLRKWTQFYWQFTQLPTNPSGLEEVFADLGSADVGILDLDGLQPSEWLPFLRTLNSRKDAPPLLILMTESQHEAAQVRALRLLSRSGKWRAFAKPIALGEFIHGLNEAIAD